MKGYINEALNYIENSNASKGHRILIITGGINSGKSSLAAELVKKLYMRNIHVGGVKTKSVYDSKHKNGYVLCSIDEKIEETAVHEDINKLDGDSFFQRGRFYFSESVYARLNTHVMREIESGISCFLIDELGPVELNKQGHYDMFHTLLGESGLSIVVVVRNSLLLQVEALIKTLLKDKLLPKADIYKIYI
ncbi:MAG: hypothetical protein K9L24_00630 [Spirochaetia bacterium]|nr:hypothetical protein [Spirochaetia bacterium]MCF7946317.1 hypothetical protein [Spirochaetia bacterium]